MQERQIIRRAQLSLTSESVQRSADEAVAIAVRANGYVTTRQDQHQGEHVTQSVMTLRVPALSFDSVLVALKGQGSVINESITGQDVTEEFSDVTARLRAQETLESRLLALTASRDAVKDLLEVERELARVRSQIETLTGRKQLLANQTAFGSIELTVLSPQRPAVGSSESIASQLGNAVSDGLEMTLMVTTGLIQVAFAFLPFLPLPIFLYVFLRSRRRRREPQVRAHA